MTNAFHLIETDWGARAETPLRLAERFLETLDHLRRLGPVFEDWLWLESIRIEGEEEDGRLISLDENPIGLARAVEHNVSYEHDWTYTPNPAQGYFLLAATNKDDEPNYVQMAVSAADIKSSYVLAFANNAGVDFAANEAPPTVVTFDIVKSILLIVAETWEASSGIAFSGGDFDMALAGKGFKWGWMTYLSPYFSRLIEPPCGIVLEHRPNGGLFMASTTDVFDPANPIHYDAAQTIRAALEPLNDLAFPLDQPYRLSSALKPSPPRTPS